MLQTAKELFELDFDERCSIEDATAQLLGPFLPDAASENGFDPLYEPPFFIRHPADDRTLWVDVIVELLSVPLLLQIKNDLLERFPLWRIKLIGEDPATAITIYQTAIRFAGCPPKADVDEELSRLIAKERVLRESLQRPKRAYYQQVRTLLGRAAESFSQRPFCIAGVLDNYLGDRQQLAILPYSQRQQR